MPNRLGTAFSLENTLLITNTLLQFFLLGGLNIAFVMTTNDSWTYSMAMSSLTLTIMTHTLLPASYETSKKTRGLYFECVETYNHPMIAASGLTLVTMIYELIKQNTIISHVTALILINLVRRYLRQYLTEKSASRPTYDSDESDNDEFLEEESSDSLSELDNINSDTNNGDTNNGDVKKTDVQEASQEIADNTIEVTEVPQKLQKDIMLKDYGYKVCELYSNKQEALLFAMEEKSLANSVEVENQQPESNELEQLEIRAEDATEQANELGQPKVVQEQLQDQCHPEIKTDNEFTMHQYGYYVTDPEPMRREALALACYEHDVDLVIEKLVPLKCLQYIIEQQDAIVDDIQFIRNNFFTGK